jgi:hypothetical protein
MANIAVNWKQIQGIIGDVTSGLGDNQTVTLRRPSSSDAIAAEPWEGPDEPTSSDTFSSIPAVVATESQMERDETGTNIANQVIKAVIGGGDLSVIPQIGWEIDDDKTSVTYSVKKVRKIQPGRDVLVYVVEGRA